MLTTDHIDFKLYVDNLSKRRRTFIVESKRTSSSLLMNDKIVLIAKKKQKKRSDKDKNNHKSIISLFAQVQKNVNKYLRQVDFDIKVIKQKANNTETNLDKWRELPIGATFWYVDVKHCYWRIAFLKGYISKKLYETTLMKPELKVQRNMSLALIIAPKKRTYYEHGVLIAEVEEDKRMYRTVYNNIRFTAYNVMGACMKLSGKHFIGYRTDGVMVMENKVNNVVELMHSEGFNCTITECKKLSKDRYLYDVHKKNKTKKF